MISLKLFFIAMFIVIADWSNIIPKEFFRHVQKVPVKYHKNQYLR